MVGGADNRGAYEDRQPRTARAPTWSTRPRPAAPGCGSTSARAVSTAGRARCPRAHEPFAGGGRRQAPSDHCPGDDEGYFWPDEFRYDHGRRWGGLPPRV